MISDLKPYATYKNSSVSWLGKVPEHWDIAPLGALLRERGETNDEGQVTEVLSVLKDRGVIPYADKGNIGNKKSDDITRYKIVRPNDIVVNSMNVIIGSVGLSSLTGCLSPVYYVLTRRSDVDDPGYLSAYFSTKPFQRSLVRIGNGILAHRMRISMELMKREPFPRPPSDEQAAIVRFLDHADGRIRRYIGAKQKLIKLLDEQKRVIAHRAVTEGVHGSVKKRPSGVDWLGHVPAHWEIKRLKFLARMKSGENITSFEIEDSGEYPVYGGNGLRGYTSAFTHEGDYVLIGRQGALCGNINYAHGRFWASEHAVVATLAAGHDLVWFGALLRAMNLNQYSQAAAQPGLAVERIANIPVPVPDPAEQKEIAQHIEAESRSVDQALAVAEGEVALLHEYQARLVVDVVTGRLDVREAVRVLPEAPEGPPLVDAELDEETIPEILETL